MEAALAVALLTIVALTAALVLLWRRGQAAVVALNAEDRGGAGDPSHAELLGVIRLLPGLVLLLDDDGQLQYASEECGRMGLVKRGEVVFQEITGLARQASERNGVLIREMSVRRPPLRKGLIDLRVRAIRLSEEQVLLLIDDLTEVRRVADVRRDFIANVSHELKTPVGAISLLSEAIMSASDDPAAVEHFATRLHIEAGRLASLVNDVIDLSRLQGGDPLTDAEPVVIDDVVTEAVDHIRAAAEAKEIEVVVGGSSGLQVIGTGSQLVTAVRNLLANAVAYSPENTRVAVAVRLHGATVEIAVKDQGMGIEESEQGRIFERFYRVDEARSRVTGGTGLGLAIVRNVCRNHGGDATVWSVVGEGSTFTIQLPVHQPEPTPNDGADPWKQPHRVAERSKR